MTARTIRIGRMTRGILVTLMFSTLMLGATIAYSAEAPQTGIMPTLAPMMDSTLMSWLGTWGGKVTMGNQVAYGEATFSPAVGHQWVEGVVHMWADTSKKTAVADFVMFVRPGEKPGVYKAHGMGSDGTSANGMVTVIGGICHWIWSYDNETKEVGTLKGLSPDHLVYASTITDKTGKVLMELTQDMLFVKSAPVPPR